MKRVTDLLLTGCLFWHDVCRLIQEIQTCFICDDADEHREQETKQKTKEIATSQRRYQHQHTQLNERGDMKSGHGQASRGFTQASLGLVVLVACLHSSCHALSLPGRRHPSPRNPSDRLGGRRSSTPASPLFALSSHRRDRRWRKLAQQQRKRLFRRAGNLQLNYKDQDDELQNVVASPQPLRLLRRRPRIASSKAPFPPLVERSVDGFVYRDPMTNMQDADGDGATLDEEVAVAPMPTTALAKTRRRTGKKKVVVSNVSELHEAILDCGLQLRDIELKYTPPPSISRHSLHSREKRLSTEATRKLAFPDDREPNAKEWQLIGNVIAEESPFFMEVEEEVSNLAHRQPFSHDVLNLLHDRYRSKSTPGSRAPDDTAILSLSIEGGGMRGAVSGGMAAAITCLGLGNAFDSVYGSSAGSIIGSYFVSRQLYLDVFTDVLVAGKDLFASKGKILGDVFRNIFRTLAVQLRERTDKHNVTSFDTLPPTRDGGLNTSFVLDGIMCPENGLRPLGEITGRHFSLHRVLSFGRDMSQLELSLHLALSFRFGDICTQRCCAATANRKLCSGIRIREFEIRRFRIQGGPF